MRHDHIRAVLVVAASWQQMLKPSDVPCDQFGGLMWWRQHGMW